MRRPVTTTSLLLAALPIALVAPGAAHAGRPPTADTPAPEHFHDTFTGAWPCWSDAPEDPEDAPDPDYVLTLTGDVRGVTAFRTTGRDDVAGFHETVHGTETWTLVADGEEHTLTHVFHANLRDLSVVDEGTTLQITSQGAGNNTWYLDGERIARNPGMNRVQFRVEHQGTLTDPEDDSFVEGSFRVVKESTGLTEMPDLDPCAVLAPFA